MPTAKPPNPWDAAKRRKVIRGNHEFEPAPLEPGVKFFVLMLEQLGCTTIWSCEGHPAGFSVVFAGPERIARAIDACGYLTVSLFRGDYSISLETNELHSRDPWTQAIRDECLRGAADAWVRQFGPLGAAGPAPVFVDPRGRLGAAVKDLIIAAIVLAYDGDDIGLDDAIADAKVALAVWQSTPAPPAPA